MIFVIFFLVIHFHEDAHCLAEHIDTLNQAAQTVFSLHLIADFGQIAVQFLVCFGLVFEAAHQTPADARDLAGIEGKILLLGHLDGDRNKLAHPCMTAERSAADAVASQYFGLVADADLAQLDAGPEYAGQVFDQVAEVHAPVRRKIEQHLTVVECVLRVDELHLEAVRLDLLLADAVSLLLLDAVAALRLIVLGSRDADYVFERLLELARLNVHRKADDRPVLDASDSLDDHVIAVPDYELSRVKIENFDSIPEPHANYTHRCIAVVNNRLGNRCIL